MPQPISHHSRTASALGQKSTYIGIAVNIVLAAVKGTAGIVGNSYALIADAIESITDVASSIAVLLGLKMAVKPADDSHPYGHGKFEPLAALIVSFTLFVAAILIAVESVREIVTPHHAPAPFTLAVLVIVILVKETLFRFVIDVGESVDSTAVKADAWHHRSDAITSLVAFVGISIAIIGGKGYESADDFAALIAAVVIAINSVLIFKPALFELTDTALSPEIVSKVREVAESTAGVFGTHKCYVRKLGFDHVVDLDILCDPNATIREGHEIAHNVGDALRLALPKISKVLVHVEPVDDYGRRSKG